eukprot:TRINITY_DN840_c0_g1_i2.p2 TRINITY_DN840_c0_g1~~TRINITY_DN840_c0_g1_i2.p2  ORF type:complete len:514 (+),score=52.46 TRINITY_DN840_c0_g1_i2:74-1543(+)
MRAWTEGPLHESKRRRVLPMRDTDVVLAACGRPARSAAAPAADATGARGQSLNDNAPRGAGPSPCAAGPAAAAARLRSPTMSELRKWRENADVRMLFPEVYKAANSARPTPVSPGRPGMPPPAPRATARDSNWPLFRSSETAQGGAGPPGQSQTGRSAAFARQGTSGGHGAQRSEWPSQSAGGSSFPAGHAAGWGAPASASAAEQHWDGGYGFPTAPASAAYAASALSDQYAALGHSVSNVPYPADAAGDDPGFQPNPEIEDYGEPYGGEYTQDVPAGGEGSFAGAGFAGGDYPGGYAGYAQQPAARYGQPPARSPPSAGGGSLALGGHYAEQYGGDYSQQYGRDYSQQYGSMSQRASARPRGPAGPAAPQSAFRRPAGYAWELSGGGAAAPRPGPPGGGLPQRAPQPRWQGHERPLQRQQPRRRTSDSASLCLDGEDPEPASARGGPSRAAGGLDLALSDDGEPDGGFPSGRSDAPRSIGRQDQRWAG